MGLKRSSRIVANPLVAAFSGAGLILYVYIMVSERLQYQYWIPFAIGGLLTGVALLWPIRRLQSTPRRHLANSLTCMLLLGPVPWGPEGTLVPALVAGLFPPLVLLILFPIGPTVSDKRRYSLFLNLPSRRLAGLPALCWREGSNQSPESGRSIRKA